MENSYRPRGKEYLYVNDDKMLKIDHAYIEQLKVLAKMNGDGRCTMCLHSDTREHVHEMINVYPKGMYVRPHSHPFKTETKIVIEGKMVVIIFNGEGEVCDRFIMDANGIFTFRMEKDIIHTNIPLTDVVFHEVIAGPYVGKDDSVYPAWAPESFHTDTVEIFMKKIEKKIGFPF